MTHPIRDPQVQDDIVRKAELLQSSYSAGKVSVEFYLKDGRWALGNVTVTFPRRRHDE